MILATSTFLVGAVALLHGLAAAEALLRGHFPLAVMLAGFFLADLGILWLARS